MRAANSMTDGDLLAAFLARAIPHDQWTHEAHLRIAWLFVRDCPLDDAHILFRIALIRLNDAHGVPESPTRGYHETITRAWLVVIADAARREPVPDSRVFFGRNPRFMDKTYLSRHYSAARLMSAAARARFVEPDLAPLPAPA